MPTEPLVLLDELRNLYDITLESIRAADAEKRAPLIARAESIVTQIEQLTPASKAGDPIDEIAQRRAARGAGAAKGKRKPAAN